MSVPRSVRFDEDVLARLDRYVRAHPGSSASSVVNMLVDEALRVDEHPGIVFRPGPTGRRAALAGGPDVWDVIAAMHAIRQENADLEGEWLVKELGAVTGLNDSMVNDAVRYYAAYPDEIDTRIASNHDAADREQRLQAAQHALLRARNGQ